jgi:DNA-directed RNA polymerase subunit RPC12/RpoP
VAAQAIAIKEGSVTANEMPPVFPIFVSRAEVPDLSQGETVNFAQMVATGPMIRNAQHLRVCTDCNEAKTEDQFTGRYNQCKPCRSKRVGKYNISDERILKVLQKRMTSGELSRVLKCPLTTLHSRLERMLADGLVEKEVVATTPGRKAYWRSKDAT